MPANMKGGKGYRKGKHGADDAKMLEWDTEKGEMLGRTVKKLGDRRFRVFCNDNKERICKLAGSMRKSQWVDEGVLVLIGIREIGTSLTEKSQEIGDILSLVDPQLYGKLKKQEGLNVLLFTNLENEDSAAIRRKIKAQEEGGDVDDDFFQRNGEEDEEEAKDETEEDKEGRKLNKKLKDLEIDKKRDQKYLGDNDDENKGRVNVDDL
jgi:initiation factor 1A